MTVQQMSLLGQEIELPAIITPKTPKGDRPSIADQFVAFHAHNPHVYTALRQLALGLAATGRRRGSINQLFEVLRYEYALRTKGDEYKLNNNYRALYARMLMKNEPGLIDWFEIRELRN